MCWVPYKMYHFHLSFLIEMHSLLNSQFCFIFFLKLFTWNAKMICPVFLTMSAGFLQYQDGYIKLETSEHIIVI